MADPSPVAPAQQAMTGPMVDPAVLQSLLGTLMQGQISGLSQADLEQQQAALHGQVQQAAEASNQATQQYQQAASAPPGPSPTNFYDQLLGNTASVLSGNQNYQQQAQNRLQQHIQEIDKGRMANLMALKDQAEQKAQAAEKLGNAEVAAKSRMSVEQYNSKMKLIAQGWKQAQDEKNLDTKGQQASDLENQRQGGRMDLEKLRQQGRESLAQFRESLSVDVSPADAAKFEANSITTWNGRRVVDIDLFTGKAKERIAQWAAENGAVMAKHDQMKVLQDIQGARANTDKIIQSIGPKLSKSAAERFTTGLANRFSRIFQTTPELGGYQTWRGSAIRALRAAAGSGGLRLNQAEINLAVKNDIPDEMDTYDTAMQKLSNLTDMLDSAEDPLTTSDWRPLAPTGGARLGATAAEKAAANKPAAKGDPLGVR